MRDPIRDQQSAESYADFAEADLVAMAQHLNRELLRRTLVLAGLVVDALVEHRNVTGLVRLGREFGIARALRTRVRAVRYEIVRRRRRDTPAGSPVVNIGPIKQVNSETKIDVGTQSGGSVTGLDIGSIGDTHADP